MKNLLLSLLTVIIYTQSFAQTEHNHSHNHGADTIKIMSYNIWNGFDWGKEKEREERFIQYMINEDLDVFALQELCGITQERLSELAKQWGHDYAIIHKEKGYPVGITSKKPIELIGKLTENVGHGMLHVKTYGYNFIITHLNPGDSKQRLVEVNNIVDYMTKNNLTEKTMVMGDMNAHAPSDAAYLEENKPTSGEEHKNLLNGNYDYSPISRFLSYPLIDVCQRHVAVDKRETYPTLIFWPKDRAIPAERKTERIDFILVTSDLEKNVAGASIPNRGGADYLSDHYPVIMNLIDKK